MRDYPRLSWLNAKTYPQSGNSRKGRSGHLPEHIEASGINVVYDAHTEAVAENASRIMAKEIDKALTQ